MNENIYAPPTSELTQKNNNNIVLAKKRTRLGAILIDGFISTVIMVPIMYATSGFDKISGPGFSLTYYLGYMLIGLILFIFLHGILLAKNGQTIGKKVTGIRIADLEGNVPKLSKHILPRYAFTTIVPNIPILGSILSIVDSLMIFRKDRRCLHDIIARTQVIVDRDNNKS